VEARDNAELARYELVEGDEVVALAKYRDQGGVRVLPHVETARAHRNQGLAGEVVAFALDDIRAQGKTVVPACPFAAQYVAEHPEYADLVARR
jgi:uncharacterized protein